jgi:3D (Asp-Asp-Asp) domain-containing protein
MKVSYGSKQGYIYAKFLKELDTPLVEAAADSSSNTLDTSSGILQSYLPSTDLSSTAASGTDLGTFKLTFYCGCASCSEQWGKQTSTGTTCVEGRTIAVDPTVIPYGTRVHIDGFGDFVAEDCGGAIKGNHIDIYLEDHERCNALGVQYADVTILD